jgi:hypothetical protein
VGSREALELRTCDSSASRVLPEPAANIFGA